MDNLCWRHPFITQLMLENPCLNSHHFMWFTYVSEWFEIWSHQCEICIVTFAINFEANWCGSTLWIIWWESTVGDFQAKSSAQRLPNMIRNALLIYSMPMRVMFYSPSTKNFTSNATMFIFIGNAQTKTAQEFIHTIISEYIEVAAYVLEHIEDCPQHRWKFLSKKKHFQCTIQNSKNIENNIT